MRKTLLRNAWRLIILALVAAISPVLTIWSQVLLAQILGEFLTASRPALMQLVTLLILATGGSVIVAFLSTWLSPNTVTTLSTEMRTSVHRQVATGRIPDPRWVRCISVVVR